MSRKDGIVRIHGKATQQWHAGLLYLGKGTRQQVVGVSKQTLSAMKKTL